MSFRWGRLVEVGKPLMRDIEGRMMKKSVCSSSDHSLLDKWHLHTDLESLGVPEIQIPLTDYQKNCVHTCFKQMYLS